MCGWSQEAQLSQQEQTVPLPDPADIDYIKAFGFQWTNGAFRPSTMRRRESEYIHNTSWHWYQAAYNQA